MNEQVLKDHAYVNSQATCAMIEAMGMVADNQACAAEGQPNLYGKFEFDALIEKYGIHHNQVVSILHHN